MITSRGAMLSAASPQVHVLTCSFMYARLCEAALGTGLRDSRVATQ